MQLLDLVDAIVGYAVANRLEAAGAFAGLICVLLLVRESLWNWPFGVVYAGISVYLFAQQPLYGQVLLNGYFVVMNLIGWWLWIAARPSGEERLLVTRSSLLELSVVLLAATLGVVALAILFDQYTASRLPALDASVTLLSIAAMWLQARKRLDSWVFWFVVNIASVVLYVATDTYFYAALYLIYVPMAVIGFMRWRHTMRGVVLV